MVRKPLFAILFLHFLFPVFASQVNGLDLTTHELLNEYVARRDLNDFYLHSFLNDQLGLRQGIETELWGFLKGKQKKQETWQWFRKGGNLEDSPLHYVNTRSRHHYHNPLTDQGFSGIGGTGFLSGESSIHWSQRPAGTQNPDGFYSWNDVRSYFYEALTAPDQITKERMLSETFRGLGQLMHLLQDLSVPEHARDDGHYLGNMSLGLVTHYEQWVGNTSNVRIVPETGQILVKEFPLIPKTFDSSTICNPSGFSPIAPVPVANLFDTNQYTMANPDPAITLTSAIGLSEYTNANFLSPDTMFTEGFPHPNIHECVVRVDPRNSRKYFSSIGEGENINHLAVVSWLGYWLDTLPEEDSYHVVYYPSKLDPYCFEEYAQKLIPRAVGYSASLLRYFFRGELAVQSFPIYTQSYQSVTGLKLRVRNVTPTREAMSEGSLSVVCSFKNGAGEEVFLRAQDHEVTDLLHGDELEHSFVFEDSSGIPIEGFGSMKCMLAYRGNLGNEVFATDNEGNITSFGAVVGKAVPLAKFNESWDRSLTGNYAWSHTPAGTQPANGETSNRIGSLIKDNIRWAGYDTARVNESYFLFKNAQSPDGLFISPNTRLQFKIDELSINAFPPAPPGMTSNLQALELHFNQGRHFQFSQEGQFMYFNNTTAYATFPLGVPVELSIYELFQEAGIGVPQPLYLQYINFIQQLLNLEIPSSQVHHQHMKVDYIRIVEPED